MYRDEHQRDFARTLRNQSTEAERRLWRLLRAQQLRGHKFCRQAAGTIRCGWSSAHTVDFVCFSHKLIIEVDGPQHIDPPAAEYDARRTQWLSSRGFRVLRFRDQELGRDRAGTQTGKLYCLFGNNGGHLARSKQTLKMLFAKSHCQPLISATNAPAENSLVFGHHFG